MKIGKPMIKKRIDLKESKSGVDFSTPFINPSVKDTCSNSLR